MQGAEAETERLRTYACCLTGAVSQPMCRADRPGNCLQQLGSTDTAAAVAAVPLSVALSAWMRRYSERVSRVKGSDTSAVSVLCCCL